MYYVTPQFRRLIAEFARLWLGGLEPHGGLGFQQTLALFDYEKLALPEIPYIRHSVLVIPYSLVIRH